MKEITLLGCGVSGISFIERIRENGLAAKIVLIDKKNYYSERELSITHPADFKECWDLKKWAEEKNIEFIEAEVERINIRRRKVYFKQHEARDFEQLVVSTGLVSKKLPVKGEHREGFFYLSDIDAWKLKDLLKLSPEACVYASTFLGLKLAVSLASLKKEVRIVAENLDFLGSRAQEVIDYLGQRGISLYLNSHVEEAVGESRIKAIKISPLKVFPSQLLFIDSGFTVNKCFFEEEIISSDAISTISEGLYFMGDVSSKNIGEEIFFKFNHTQAKEDALALADYMVKGEPLTAEKMLLSEEGKNRLIDEFLAKQVCSNN
ncbi:MAG: FAD/NAD(P)-binding oxidoreductase [Candidatus Omnitrophica bacterium]|nr:FAD/NAD(P)-binding oxidoreductase [Candidatus Omnitrophota bacterium]MDD5430382.1 FAD/NAD(P)-binding oxidoreductase [Candidatus Omnitrophota bacterium]